jgi:phenylacetate-CoA ligase
VLIDIEFLRTLSKACSPNGECSSQEESLELVGSRELLLLKQTLEYAQASVPYYRESFRRDGFDVAAFNRLSDIRALPVLTKQTMVSRLEEFVSQAPELHINSLVSTSGTTGNHRLPRVISDEELEACALLTGLSRSLGNGGAGAGGDILLRVFPTMRRYAGPGREAGLPQITVNLSLHFPKYALHRSNYEDFVLKQLFEKFPIPRTTGYITVVHTTPPYLMRIISDELVARGLSARDTHVRCIACTGGYVTSRIRALVSDFWRVPLLTSYSLTEFNGYAMGCSMYPNRYHFDSALFAEVVDPVTHRPVAEGRQGSLLITSLYPFQQAQIFVRYDTGDLVTYVGRICGCGHAGTTIEYLGRSGHCLDLGDILPAGCRQRFLASCDIHDVLEDIPEIPSLLYPRFSVDRLEDENRPGLRLTTEVYQLAGPDMLESLQRRIRSALLARYPELERLVQQERLRWETHICNRGEIDHYVRLYPDS